MKWQRSTAGNYLKMQQMRVDLSPEQAPSANARCPKPWQQQYVENDLNVQWPKTALRSGKGLGGIV